MFCPECRAEYRPGFYECSDCHVPLVGSLPPEPVEPPPGPFWDPAPRPGLPNPDAELVVVFESGDPFVLGLAEGALESGGIPYLLSGEGRGRTGLIDPAVAGWQQFVVARENEEEARRLLEPLTDPQPLPPEGAS